MRIIKENNSLYKTKNWLKFKKYIKKLSVYHKDTF